MVNIRYCFCNTSRWCFSTFRFSPRPRNKTLSPRIYDFRRVLEIFFSRARSMQLSSQWLSPGTARSHIDRTQAKSYFNQFNNELDVIHSEKRARKNVLVVTNTFWFRTFKWFGFSKIVKKKSYTRKKTLVSSKLCGCRSVAGNDHAGRRSKNIAIQPASARHPARKHRSLDIYSSICILRWKFLVSSVDLISRALQNRNFCGAATPLRTNCSRI